MSEETNTAEKEEVSETREGIKYTLKDFREGQLKDFKFFSPEALTMADAVTRWGEQSLLDLVNSQVGIGVRAKVRNSNECPKEWSEAKTLESLAKLKVEHPDFILYSIEDASTWKPGEAKEKGLPGLMKEVSRLKKECQAALANNDKPLAMKLKAEMLQALAKMNELSVEGLS